MFPAATDLSGGGLIRVIVVREVGVPSALLWARLVGRSVVAASARAIVHVGKPVLRGLATTAGWLFGLFAISGLILAALYVLGSVVGVVVAPVAGLAGIGLDENSRVVSGAAVGIAAWLGLLFTTWVRKPRSAGGSVVLAAVRRRWRTWRFGWQGVAAELTLDRGASWAVNEALNEQRAEDERRLDGEESRYQAAIRLGLNSGERALESTDPTLAVEPISGYRAWKLMPGTRLGLPAMEAVLGSRVLRSVWPGPHLEARCEGRGWSRLHGPERLPVLDCTCGVYALKERPEMKGESGVWVIGEVALWGRVLEGSKGYRAEHAQVLGPLTVEMSCSHATGPTTTCGGSATLVVCRETEYLPRCETHRGAPGPAVRLEPVQFLATIAAALIRRYGVDVGESEPAAA